MKGTIILLCGILTFFAAGAQDFNFTDSTFKVGAQLTRRQIYTPNCQIDTRYLPFVDSLVNFLQKNGRLKIKIEFFGDGYDDNEEEKNRQKICGQKRLVSRLTHYYPNLNQDRIEYVFHGNDSPIYTKEEILQMKDRSDQVIAYRTNRRTVITISAI